MKNYDDMKFRKYTFKSEFDKAIHTLEGMIGGISLDRIINTEELHELLNWCAINHRFIDVYPFKEIIPLLELSLEDLELSQDEIEDVLWVCNNYKSESKYYDIITSDIQRLHGLLHGILADNRINQDELTGLQQWLDDNEHLVNTYPYDEVYSLVLSVLADKRVDENEVNLLKVFFSEFINTSLSLNISLNEINRLREEITISGICAVCPEIGIENSYFCFTGASSRTTRNELKSIVGSFGGFYNDNLVKSTNYLVVGDSGNPCWAFACYGRKVEKAMQLRKDGHPILIVHENDFWDAVEDLR